jgi:hypothetical protein
LSYSLKRRARIENAAASGTKDVPRHIEKAESRAVQESANHIVLIEPVPGGKGEGVDTAKLAIRRVVDELFDRTHRFRLRRLSQSTKEILSFGGKFHGCRCSPGRRPQIDDRNTVTVWLGKRKASDTCPKKAALSTIYAALTAGTFGWLWPKPL